MDLSNEINKINQDLAQKGISLRIEQRGHRLNIRGPLPKRSDEGVTKNQRLSLRITADLKGLQEAERILQLILLQLEHKQFNWNNWSRKKQLEEKTEEKSSKINNALRSFESNFFLDPQSSL